MSSTPYDVLMKFGVIGSGRMGTSLGAAIARIGHEVMMGSRRGPHSYRDAARFGEAIVLATEWTSTRAALESCDALGGKVLISCVNPETDDSPLVIGHTTSAAEEIARVVPRAHVVEAFNGIYAEAIDQSPAKTTATVCFCTDHDDARALASGLVTQLGFDALDCGPLQNARYLEPLVALTVYLVRKAGYGPLGIHVEWRRSGQRPSRPQ